MMWLSWTKRTYSVSNSLSRVATASALCSKYPLFWNSISQSGVSKWYRVSESSFHKWCSLIQVDGKKLEALSFL